ncbi:hypothetical protein F4777DRAFT_575815 [Nemania sp. FL0916]|nr:hypothetical protein F4777DRAFT_575815 [Nemania sp. FL0916]
MSTDHPPPELYTDITDSLNKYTLLAFDNPPFLTRFQAEKFLKNDVIETALKVKFRETKDLVKYVNKGASKVFLILVYSGALKKIEVLREAGFSDENLPIYKDAQGHVFSHKRSGGRQYLECFESKWSPAKIDWFRERQWALLPVTLEKSKFHYHLEKEQPFPFLSLENAQQEEGGFGAVQQRSGQILRVAVKVLSVEGQNEPLLDKFYKREADTLDIMRQLGTPHLIKAYAAFTRKTGRRGYDRGFIFPWISGGNLSVFWLNTKNQMAEDPRRFDWAFSQMLGLAKAIKILHDKKTRHGDIKPANILNNRGILMIADVGLAKFHALYTRERRQPTTTDRGSRMYEPPEAVQRVKLSRRYDVWSFGCVLFECLLWLIGGPGTYHKFLNQARNNQEIEQPYWETPQNGTVLRPVILKWIRSVSTSIQDAPSQYHRTLKRLLALIQERLLIVNLAQQSQEKPRADSDELVAKLEKILGIQNPIVSSSVSDPMLHELTMSSTSVVSAQAMSRILSNNKISKLEDSWEDITDNEIAREIMLNLHLTMPDSSTDNSSEICDHCKDLDFTTDIVHLEYNLTEIRKRSNECGVYSAAETSSYARIGLPQVPEAASDQEFALLNEWKRLCDETHSCLSAQEDRTYKTALPTRVLDVGTLDNPSVRLVEPKPDMKAEYAALSHCWGHVPKENRLCLENENLSDFLNGIDFQKLPKLFQDAVTVTRALNIRYLWIDSLCIIQNSKQDWDIESKKMEDVYSQAYVTIAASSAGSSVESFLKPRRSRAWAKLQTPDGPLYIAEAIDDFQTDVENAVLSTRAWVLQERTLSRRTIHFTSSQVYWECGEGVHCETLARLRNPMSQFLGDKNFPNIGLSYFKDERIQLIQYLFTRYSELGLSRATDRPAAIAGLQDRLGRTFKSDADYGVLWKFFERTILWKRTGRALSRIDYTDSAMKPPSWSWMAFLGTIGYLEIPFGNVDWTGDLENPLLDAQSSARRDASLRAKVRKITLDKAFLSSSVTLDEDIELNPEDGQWRCVTVGKDKTPNCFGDIPHYVLVVRPVVHHGNDITYERIGVGVFYETDFSDEIEEGRII